MEQGPTVIQKAYSQTKTNRLKPQSPFLGNSVEALVFKQLTGSVVYLYVEFGNQAAQFPFGSCESPTF
jgi:hypothetical protein